MDEHEDILKLYENYQVMQWEDELEERVDHEKLTLSKLEEPVTHKRLSLSDFISEGYLSEVNRRFFHPLGLAMFVDEETGDIGFFDNREDPEGWYYSDEIMDAVIFNADIIHEHESVRYPIREAALGYVVQPLTKKLKEKD